jgi:hypothetical protein
MGLWKKIKELLGINGGMIMPKKPDVVDINVLVTRNADDPCDVSFELEAKNGPKVTIGKKPNGKDFVDFKNINNPGFLVCFNIVEHGPLKGCQFLPDPDDAMWVQPSSFQNAPCPSSPAYWSQFRALDVVSTGANDKNKTLVVYNKNDYPQYFGFTLRFEVEGCDKVFEFDPIGNDQNGQEY